MMEGKPIPKVAFVCVRNACRSQMAEAIARVRFSDTIEAFPQAPSLARKSIRSRQM